MLPRTRSLRILHHCFPRNVSLLGVNLGSRKADEHTSHNKNFAIDMVSKNFSSSLYICSSHSCVSSQTIRRISKNDMTKTYLHIINFFYFWYRVSIIPDRALKITCELNNYDNYLFTCNAYTTKLLQ